MSTPQAFVPVPTVAVPPIFYAFYHPVSSPSFHPHQIHPSSADTNHVRTPHCSEIQKKSESPILSAWWSPSVGTFKLNTDGSSLGNPGPSSYGGVIRDHSGRWVCGYMGRIGHGTSLVAELWGIFKGLCLLQQIKLREVVVESDCIAAINLITYYEGIDENHSDRHKIAESQRTLTKRECNMIEESRRILRECECILVHTRRAGNHSADQLAKLGGRRPEEYTVLEYPPAMVVPFLLADAAVASRRS